MRYTAHVDTFTHDNLPPRHQWPELLLELPELQYPARLNCATELLDKPVTRGHGHRIALRTRDGECTYTQLFTQANRLANVLVREMGLRPGHRVLLRGPNNPMMVACWFAVMKAGGVCVTASPELRAKELAELIAKAGITHAMCDKRFEPELTEASSTCPTLKNTKYWLDDAEDSLDSLVLRQPLWFTNVATSADDVALIAFTPGAGAPAFTPGTGAPAFTPGTGAPRGAMHFHRDVVAMCDCFPRSILKTHKDDVFCGTPPLASTFGLGALLCFPMRFGASAVLAEEHTAETLLGTIDRFSANVCFAPPSLYLQMAGMAKDFSLRSLRKCVSAGEALPEATRQLFKEATGIGIIDGLASTEMMHMFVSHTPERARRGAAGYAVPGYRAVVLDGEGKVCHAGEAGRLAVKGPTGCLYLADEHQAQYVQGGWNLTGDAGFMDGAGYFFPQGAAA